MIPQSLELNKLITQKIKIRKSPTNKEKRISKDIINIKFTYKVDSGACLIAKLYNKIDSLNETREDYKNKLLSFIEQIKSEISDDKWHGKTSGELRELFYEDGFVLNNEKYVVYKRSSAKSRVGECLFIKQRLYDHMIKWSRMGIEFRGREGYDIDYPSLLAYESLVGSSLESLVQIKPENILIVTDVESKFNHKANIIKTGNDGYLDSFAGETLISNSLFDGESLLEASYFPRGKSMMLLRNHMFKSAAFNCNIQTFLRSRCPANIEYDDWEISTMFKNLKVKAKDVHLIITPSSLKALKFSHLLGSEKSMWIHWKRVVEKDMCLFGVCKSEKESKRGMDVNGNTLQQTSYQMLNSLPIHRDDIDKLTELELNHIDNLKNNDEVLVESLISTANDLNVNKMFYDLYKRNRDVSKTELFKSFRRTHIHNYVSHVKRGKVRLKGDYLVMLGNPLEYLLHAVGELDQDSPQTVSLKANEVCSTKFLNGRILSGFRNPHTSPNNVLVVQNVLNEKILQYFNLSENIVCVNAIDFPIQDILSGADYDSDTVLLIDDVNLNEITRRVYGLYDVCVNHVVSSKRKYDITNQNMAIIDNQLSNSQRFIGRVVNTGQLCMSRYWDVINRNQIDFSIKELLKKIDVVTVLSGICIDLAKKMFEIDINKEINNIVKSGMLIREKPMFWKYVSKSDTIKTQKYSCPMDYLYEKMSNLEYAERRETVNFEDLLNKFDLKNGLRKQEKKTLEYIEQMIVKLNNIYTSDHSDDEKFNMAEDTIRYCEIYVSKLKISKETMYSLVRKIIKDSKNKMTSRTLNVLFKTQKDVFLSVFCEN
ncbi:hypothetical protein [Paenibacillus sp. QZ-Y1]|uniref:hypothetical protein n=1 Tax=Paenibacillus sp. QZ-Y1 TaxID=3414511 RepID=UPI003F78EDA0